MTRPKGFMDWQPKPETAMVIGQVNGVLREYSKYGPMTVRQIFYRLVGQYGYGKTELAYKRLAEYLVKARRSGLVSFGSIRDDGTTKEGSSGWASRAGFWRTVRHLADDFELDHMTDQPYRIELWCEAAGMAPMLANMVSAWHVPVYSTGGFSSVTVTHEVAQRIMRYEEPTVILHVGDFDPSGESIFNSMTEDIWAFLAGYNKQHLVIPERVALTADQVEEYDLPTVPPKASDSRSATWLGETVQAEALPPDLLAEIVQDAVRGHFDERILRGVLRREVEDKAEIDRILTIAESES